MRYNGFQGTISIVGNMLLRHACHDGIEAMFFRFFFVLVECIDCGACAFIVVCDLLNESAIV